MAQGHSDAGLLLLIPNLSKIHPQKKPVEKILSKAMLFHKKGELIQAEKYYRSALKLNPNHVDALHLSGIIAHQLGRNPRAVKLIRRAILNDNNQAVFHTNLAIIYNKIGNWAEAERASRASLELNAGGAEAWGNLGQALAGLGRISEAAEACEKSVTLQPWNALVYCNLASILAVLKRFEEAESACRSALKLQPKLVKAVHSLGVVQSATGRLDEAEKSFELAHRLDPLNGQTMTNLASIYSAKLKFDDAIRLFKNALETAPDSAETYLNLGVCFSETGELGEALKCLECAVKIDPENVDAYYALATSGKFVFNPGQLRRLEQMLESSALSNEDKVKLNFALGCQADKREEPESAFSFFTAGNILRRDLLTENRHNFDPESIKILVERIEKVFTSRFFMRREGFGVDTEVPVFVVGMPRSGTTLVEKIAASHKNVMGAGERNEIPEIVKKLENEVGQRFTFPEVVNDLDKGKSIALANSDLGALRAISDERRVIDKMPLNYLYLGLVALLYPRAKIIHCKRDPRDIAISCYFQNFVHIHPWSCDLGHIGNYYNSYRQIMMHWRKFLPLPIFDLQYEDLVSDLEYHGRKLIDFIGLEWDASCLNFHTSSGAVRTSSKWQVREPIYTHSVGRWKSYENYLVPLLRVLDVL